MAPATVDRVRSALRRTVSRRTACCFGISVALSLLGGCTSGSPSPGTAGTTVGSTAWHGARTVRDGDLVMRGTAPLSRLREVAQAAQRAVTRVRQVWGGSVLRGTVVIEVPKDEAQFRARGGSAEAGARIAATTTPDGRVVLAPSLFTAVTEEGRVVVLTHELTHVALGQAGLTGVPHWVIEGSAEFTAYHAGRLSLLQLVPDIASAVRAGTAPTGPPGDAEFATQPAAAYQAAYAWCRFLADRFGQARFVAFVRSADARRSNAFTATFETTVSALRGPYSAFLHTQLASSDASS